MTAQLPPGFAELEGFVPVCALESAIARDALRGAMSPEQRHAFHAAFAPRLTEALDHLNQTPLAQHSPQDRKLMLLALSYAHIAQAEEVQGPDEARHARARPRVPITRATADF